MKYFLLTAAIILGILAVYKFSDYEGRMKIVNADNCAANGYEPDCKTPLK